MRYRQSILVGLIALGLLGPLGCARIPKEAVQLSYAVGTDIQQLYTGYRTTVVFSFEQMRQRGLTVIDERWTPVYLKSFVKKGQLVESARAEQTERVEYWARRAIKDIDDKRQEFLLPLKQQEEALLADIDEAFSRTIRANAAVTAHLNSVLKVQDLQDEVLESVGLKDLRDKINDGIVKASDFAANRTEEIETATKKLEGSE